MHVKIRKRIGNPTLYNAKINYSHNANIKFCFITCFRPYMQLLSKKVFNEPLRLPVFVGGRSQQGYQTVEVFAYPDFMIENGDGIACKVVS